MNIRMFEQIRSAYGVTPPLISGHADQSVHWTSETSWLCQVKIDIQGVVSADWREDRRKGRTHQSEHHCFTKSSLSDLDRSSVCQRLILPSSLKLSGINTFNLNALDIRSEAYRRSG
jgi:hypothetical protein